MRIAPRLAFGALLATFGCNTARYSKVIPYDAACDPLPEYPCAPGPPEGPGCKGSPSASDVLEREIPPDASYPVGCTVIVPHPVKDDNGSCIFEGACRCDAPDGGGAAWACSL